MARRTTIHDLPFAHNTKPTIGVEVIGLADLRARAPLAARAGLRLPDRAGIALDRWRALLNGPMLALPRLPQPQVLNRQ